MVKKAANYFATAYLLLMFGIYPFYVEEGYLNIGEAKNRFFLAVSGAAFVVLLICYVLQLILDMKERKRTGQAYLVDWEKVSGMDLLMLLYGTVIFLSYVFAIDRKEALWGTEGWYMGLVPLLLLCGFYFLISRVYDGNKAVLIIAAATSFVVFLLGICNRFSYYPLSFAGARPEFISTLGNINWFCGYLSVAAPLGVGLFCLEENVPLQKKILLGCYVFVTFAAGFAQGSDSIFLWFGGILFFLLLLALEKRSLQYNWWMLVFLWSLSAQTVRGMRLWLRDRYNYDTGGLCGYFTDSSLTLWILALAILGMIVTKRKKTEEREVSGNIKKARRLLLLGAVLILAAGMGLALLHTIIGIPALRGSDWWLLDKNWGHGRGAAIYAGFIGFVKQPFFNKLFGAGPDCFAKAVYRIPELAQILREQFGSARLTNAHNELLTCLVNTGVSGVLCYSGILITGIYSYCKIGKKDKMGYLAALCILGYTFHNMVSFAQVLNFPFLFLIIGMGESSRRRLKEKETRDGETVSNT